MTLPVTRPRVNGEVRVHLTPSGRDLMFLWRALAAKKLARRLGGALIPAALILLGNVAMWLLLMVSRSPFRSCRRFVARCCCPQVDGYVEGAA